MKSRIFHSTWLYSTLLLSSLTLNGNVQTEVNFEPPHYKDKWQLTTSDKERIARVFVTSSGVNYILNDASHILYKGARNAALQEIALTNAEGFRNYIQFEQSLLGSDDNLYLANQYDKNGSITSNQAPEELAIYRLSPQGEQLELLLQTECQHKTLGQCRFTAPLLVSEKNNALYSLRRDGDNSWLTQTSLDGSNKSWHEIRFASVVTGRVISADERQLYLQSNSQFYVVDLASGTITHQDALPPSLTEDSVQNTLSLTADDGHSVFGKTNNKFFRLNLFNQTSPFELVWIKELAEIKGLAVPPERDIIYVWDEAGTLSWVTKSAGNTVKQKRTNDSIHKILFDSVSGWAYVLYQQFYAEELRVTLLSPSGALNDSLFSFKRDYARLINSDISLQGNVLSIGAEGKVFHYDLTGLTDFSDTGTTLSGYSLPEVTTTFNWETGRACDNCAARDKGEVTIDNANTTLLNQYHWPFIIAEHINKNSDLMRVGEKDEGGRIRPLASTYRNKIWLINRYKDHGYTLEQQITSKPESASSWKLNAQQPGITAERNLAPGTEIQVTVTQPDGSQRPLPIFNVTRGSQYLWPADLARFINQQASQLGLPIAAGERLNGDELSFPASYYRNMLWVPANADYAVQYRVKP